MSPTSYRAAPPRRDSLPTLRIRVNERASLAVGGSGAAWFVWDLVRYTAQDIEEA